MSHNPGFVIYQTIVALPFPVQNSPSEKTGSEIAYIAKCLFDVFI
jgi:hypothetical protein